MPRRARHPLAVLAVFAVIPAALLGAITVYAQGHDGALPPPTTSTTVPVALPAALATPLLSARRAPAPLASDRREDVLLDALQPLTSAVDGGSCLAVGMNDRLITGTNTSTPVIPASNLKLVVAAAAVEILGAGTVFTTTVEGAAPVNGVVDGDVYLVGGGDPLLSEAWYTEVTPNHKRPPLNTTAVDGLADAMKAAGITAITGSVIGDGSRYDDERHPPGWTADEQATRDGVPVGALVVNDSTSQSGGIASDPADSAATAFTRLLTDRGIAVGGEPGTGVAPDGTVPLATVTSQPLSAVVNEMLVTSDNLTAEMLVKEIGLAAAGQGTREDGLRAVADRLATWGIDTSAVTLVDGSGLSRDNRITCATLLSVLQRGTATDVVGAGLARAGQDGSTLDGKFEEPGLAGVLQAKTGSLTDVKALAGYLPAGGDEVEFVLILNGPSAAGFDAPWSALGTALLAAAAAPAPDSLAPAPS